VFAGRIVDGELAVFGEEENGGGGELFGDGGEAEVGLGRDFATGLDIGRPLHLRLYGLSIAQYEERGAGVEHRQ
jgi:hypothetical protein